MRLCGIIMLSGAARGRVAMTKAYFEVQKQFCGECSLALRRVYRRMDGIIAVEVENGDVAVDFDEREIPEEQVQKLTRDSIEKLGHRVEDDRGLLTKGVIFGTGPHASSGACYRGCSHADSCR